jgi:hypothetical protein
MPLAPSRPLRIRVASAPVYSRAEDAEPDAAPDAIVVALVATEPDVVFHIFVIKRI